MFVVVFSLISQLGMMFASLLPLKVLILLGSNGVPKYFPSFMGSLDQNFLVITLGILAIFFLGVHILSEQVVEFSSLKGVRKIVEKNKKTIIYNQQKNVAEIAYRKSTSGIASFLFIMLVGIYVFIFNAFVGASVVIITGLVFGGAAKVGKYKSPKMVSGVYAILPHAKLLSLFCFLGGFAAIIVVFLMFGVSSFLLSLVCLLLLRQGYNRLPSLISDVCWIDARSSKIKAIFYSEHVFDIAKEKEEIDAWKYLEGLRFKHKIAEVAGVSEVCKMDFHLLSEARGNVLEVNVDLTDGVGAKNILVKRFSGNKLAAAYHEEMIFKYDFNGICSPRFIGAIEHDGCCLVFYDVSEFSLLSSGDVAQGFSLYTRMASQAPSKELVEVYCSSSPSLWGRLNLKDFKKVLSVEALMKDVDFKSSIKYLVTYFHKLVDIIMGVPPFVYGRNVKSSLIWGREDLLYTTSWEGWAIEPIGSGWPLSEKHIEEQKRSFSVVVSERKDCSYITFDMYRLVSLSYYFDIYCRRKEYMQAVMLAPEMRQRLESIIEGGSE